MLNPAGESLTTSSNNLEKRGKILIRKLARFIPVLVAFVLSTPAATVQSVLDDRFSLSLGGFFTDRDTNTRLDTFLGAGGGTDTDVESDLGLDASDTVFRLDGYFRLNERH